MINTKILMILSSITLGLTGLVLTFIPKELTLVFGPGSEPFALIVLQLLGATYFAFAMLNWMAKDNVIGGIYSRPIAIGNTTHFFIAGLALIKFAISNSELLLFWIMGAIFCFFAFQFGSILFKHPVVKNKS